ncbi:immunity 53 family protein [Cytobacillus horneckiae]|uniref:immunity 53 family protein n=1 Tax=Cytobacillus horneckiae TaxID=549687 RepID=UPI000826637C|nr:immunity 53 family protein [Cytobacillus horneckiae]MEC1155449.1 immunity 53 family protein [Cytobacillus horneckiae]MED2940498.1 immunity 53 family protein [Cytobacillus horneckiae]
MNILQWISEWYSFHCNDEWEHEYGFKISTMDNSGFYVEIDLVGTNLENIELDEMSVTVDPDDDWFTYKINNQKFVGMGDSSKLEVLLITFKNIVETHRGYYFIKSIEDIISKYMRYGGYQGSNSVSVPYNKVHACVNEFLENNIELESIQAVEFEENQGNVIKTFSSLDDVVELEGEYHYFVNVKE